LKEFIFCGASSLTTEHLLGKWLKNSFSVSQSEKHRTEHFESQFDSFQRLIVKPGTFHRPGEPLSATTKVVCRQCNTTWMSSLENEMKHAWLDLIHGRKMTVTREEFEVGSRLR